MGIPRFFKFLSKTYPNLTTDVLAEALPVNGYIESLYVYLNSPIHTIAQRAFKYHLNREATKDDEDIKKWYRHMPVKIRRQILFKNIGLYLIYAYKVYKPTNTFMISLDGVAPKAKMVQQRMRRFRPQGAPLDFFDPVVISAGTDFMDDLDKYLRVTWPTTYRKHLSKDLVIIYSNHREPGEGERKIFDQLGVKLGKTGRRGIPYNLILGAESDLIIQSLNKDYNIIFAKEKLIDWDNRHAMDAVELAVTEELLQIQPNYIEFKNGPGCNPKRLTPENYEKATKLNWTSVFDRNFSYINIRDFRIAIQDDFLSPNDVIDFAFITFFLGNDFLPPIPEFGSTIFITPGYFDNMSILARFNKTKNVKYDSRFPLDRPGYSQYTYKGKNPNKKPPAFDVKLFEANFLEAEATWEYNEEKPYETLGEGLWNSDENRYEMFPLIHKPISGEPTRVMLYKQNRHKNWKLFKEDYGSLRQCLNIYKVYMNENKRAEGGRTNSFLVENKERINYVNLYIFLRELSLNIEQFMQAESLKHEELVKRGRKPNELIVRAVGRKKTKKGMKAKIIPAAFRAHHNAKAFGIYDMEDADPSLPKQSIDEMCRNWIEGAQWVLKYYNAGIDYVNTEWFYKFNNAPPINDLLIYIENRINLQIDRLPGAFSYIDGDDVVSAEHIIVKGGAIYVYNDMLMREVAIMKNEYGDEKFIDIDKIVFVRGNPTKEELIEYAKENLTHLTIISKNRVKLPIRKIFTHDDEIYNMVSNNSNPMPTILETFFSTMPKHILLSSIDDLPLLSPSLDHDLVNFVINQIGDAFPPEFEMIDEGFYYETHTIPKIPFVSPARVRRAIAKLPEKFDYNIAAINKTSKRLLILHKFANEISTKEIKPKYKR